MQNDHEKTRWDWRNPDELWERIEPLLPPRKPHPLGCHRPRVDDRKAMDAIFFVLRTGCQWNALNKTKICSSSSAHRRFQEWVEADVFVALWEQGLAEYDALQGVDWEWLAMDGAMTKAPLGGGKVGKNPTDRGTSGTKRRVLTDGGGIPLGLAVDGANRNEFKMARETIERIAVERPDPAQTLPRGWVWIKAMTMMRSGTCWLRLASPLTAARGGKKPRR